MGDSLQAAQQEIAKLAAENKKLHGQVVQATDAIKEVQDQLRASKGPVVNATPFTVSSDGTFLEAIQFQATTAAELQPTDSYRQVADKTFKAHKLNPLSSTQWMAASSTVFLQPFAYPKVLAEGDPVVAAGFIVSGLRAEFSTVSQTYARTCAPWSWAWRLRSPTT